MKVFKAFFCIPSEVQEGPVSFSHKDYFFHQKEKNVACFYAIVSAGLLLLCKALEIFFWSQILIDAEI